jgi:hypothetical protein
MVHAQGNVTITAEFAKSDDAVEPYNIYSVSVAGASAGSTSAVFAGQIALAGAGNRNTVEFTTQAQIVNSSTVNVGGTLSLTATDTSAIYSNAGGVGVAVAIGLGGSSTAVGVSVGAAEGHNIIDNTVESQIIDSTATAGRDVTLTASSTPEIESMAWGVAVDIAAAETAGGGTGSGAGAYNTITNTVTASIESAEVHAKKTGSVTLSAIDKPVVTADAGAGAGFLGGGAAGVGLAVGAVIVENTITDSVTARIGKSDGTAAKASTVTAANMVDVNATSEADVTSLGVAVASTVVIAAAGGGAAGSGGHGQVDITNTVTAEIAESSEVEANTIAVTAVDHDRVDNTFGAGALVGALAGGSMGVSLTDTTVANTVTATISSSRVTALDTVGEAGRVTVLVDGQNKITSMTVATAVAVSLGGSAAGGHAFSTDNSTFTASATGASTVITATQLDVVSNPTRLKAISADAHGYSGGVGTIGAVIATATDNTTRTATIGNNVDLSEVDALLLQAIGRPDLNAQSDAVAVGGVAVLVNTRKVKTTGTVEASTGDNVKMPKRLQIIADAVTSLVVKQRGTTGGVAYGGSTVARAESGLHVTATVGASPVMPEGGMAFLQVASSNRDEGTWAEAISGSGGGIGWAETRGRIIDTTETKSVIDGGNIAVLPPIGWCMPVGGVAERMS